MQKQRRMLPAAKWTAGGVGIGLAFYAAYVATTWARYGRPSTEDGRSDELLDRYMPQYEARDRHEVHVHAPAAATYVAAGRGNITESAVARALFKTREMIFGRGEEAPAVTSGTLLEQATALGWVVLAEAPGHEVVFGAVTQPWKATVIFRSIPAHLFAAFDEPGYVKIAWMMRVDADGPDRSVARTETRVATTDADARARFRWYWSFLSPGIKLIRLVMLSQTKARAEAGSRH